MARKLLGLTAFVLTGVGLMISTISMDINIFNTVALSTIAILFTVSIVDHFKELSN